MSEFKFHAEDGDSEDLGAMCDLIGQVVKAETNGDALGIIASYRKAVREKCFAGFAELSAPTALDPVVEANRAMLHARSQFGIKKYGVTLGDAKLSERALLVHALEETLDLANYLQANLMRLDAEGSLRDRILQHIEAKAQAVANQYGEYDPETGALELHGQAQEDWNMYAELSDEIRKMK